MYQYAIYVNAKDFGKAFDNPDRDKVFPFNSDTPIESLLDDEKSYIRISKKYIIMKKSIIFIQDNSPEIME